MLRKFLLVVLILFSQASLGDGFGASTSGQDISLDAWFKGGGENGVGLYFSVIADFEEYQNGSTISVCRDGQISGSFGSGTCSGHGGVSHTALADFTRFGFSFGPTYNINKSLQLHAGLLYGMYSENIDVGDKTPDSYGEWGLDIGVSFQLPIKSRANLLLRHETEQDRSLIGIWFPLF